MPTYSYECTECGNRFDIVQAFTDDALSRCENCSGRLRKRFSSVGIVFKGSGFYRTDSREPAQQSSANGSSANGSAEGSKSSETSASSDTSGSRDKTNGSSTGSGSTPSPAAASS
ncbi:MAG: zinc ribbon domain-containing protein [Mycobacterium sp.]|nr:zinc ribbon domain-containing protein [Mycobacterium sp.]